MKYGIVYLMGYIGANVFWTRNAAEAMTFDTPEDALYTLNKYGLKNSTRYDASSAYVCNLEGLS